MGGDRFGQEPCIIVLHDQFLQDRAEIALRLRPLIGSARPCAHLQNRLKCGCGLFATEVVSLRRPFGQRVDFERDGYR
jgi:hypothetical protein